MKVKDPDQRDHYGNLRENTKDKIGIYSQNTNPKKNKLDPMGWLEMRD